MRGKNRKVKAATLEGKGLLTVKDYPYPDLDKNCAIIKIIRLYTNLFYER